MAGPRNGDGNLNLVFIVSGPAGSVVVKQALPYVRMVGESWPLALSRSHYEAAALLEQANWARPFVPAVYDTDALMASIVMEHLSPHLVLRKGLKRAIRYPSVGEHLGRYLASTLFSTSDFHLPGGCEESPHGAVPRQHRHVQDQRGFDFRRTLFRCADESPHGGFFGRTPRGGFAATSS